MYVHVCCRSFTVEPFCFVVVTLTFFFIFYTSVYLGVCRVLYRGFLLLLASISPHSSLLFCPPHIHNYLLTFHFLFSPILLFLLLPCPRLTILSAIIFGFCTLPCNHRSCVHPFHLFFHSPFGFLSFLLLSVIPRIPVWC